MNLRFFALAGRGLLSLTLSALVGSILVFAMLRLLGGDVALVILGPEAKPEAVDALRLELGLNNPWYQQYFDWITGFVTGNLGRSYSGGYDIFEQITVRLGPTVLLAVGSLLVSLLLALGLGTYSAIHSRAVRGAVLDVGAQIGTAIPAFWIGLVLIYLFSVVLGWLPAGGYVSPLVDPWGSFLSLVLPIAALASGSTALLTRFVRSSMIDIMEEDYIRTGMGKGLTFSQALFRHGLRNAAIPVVTVSALQLGNLLAGTIVVENIFVIPGLGRLLMVAVYGREVMVVQSLVFTILLIILVMNFCLDLAYGLLDPRIGDRRRGGAHG